VLSGILKTVSLTRKPTSQKRDVGHPELRRYLRWPTEAQAGG
jgi:hypothetical protein